MRYLRKHVTRARWWVSCVSIELPAMRGPDAPQPHPTVSVEMAVSCALCVVCQIYQPVQNYNRQSVFVFFWQSISFELTPPTHTHSNRCHIRICGIIARPRTNNNTAYNNRARSCDRVPLECIARPSRSAACVLCRQHMRVVRIRGT